MKRISYKSILVASFFAISSYVQADVGVLTQSNMPNMEEWELLSQRIASAPCTPLVQGGEVNSRLIHSYGDIAQFVHFTYVTAKAQELGDFVRQDPRLAKAGWRHQIFEGFTGGKTQDHTGVVAYHPEKNMVVVGFHGSHCDADWLTNQDIDPTSVVLKNGISLRVHHGYALKYEQCKRNLYAVLNSLIGGLSEDKRRNLQLVVTGHSHGGGMTQMAVLDLVADFAPTYFGPRYDNTVQNQVWAWALSGPAIVRDKESLGKVHALVGQNNILSQFVYKDVVPHSTRITGYYLMGSLAIQDDVFTTGLSHQISREKAGAFTWGDIFSVEHGLNAGPRHLGVKNERGQWVFHPDLVEDPSSALARGQAMYPKGDEGLLDPRGVVSLALNGLGNIAKTPTVSPQGEGTAKVKSADQLAENYSDSEIKEIMRKQANVLPGNKFNYVDGRPKQSLGEKIFHKVVGAVDTIASKIASGITQVVNRPAGTLEAIGSTIATVAKATAHSLSSWGRSLFSSVKALF